MTPRPAAVSALARRPNTSRIANQTGNITQASVKTPSGRPIQSRYWSRSE
jgi:hypothetical protein